MSSLFPSVFSIPTNITTIMMGYSNPNQNPEKIEDKIYEVFAKKIIQEAVSSVVFLDIDGVVFNHPMDNSVSDMAKKLFPGHQGIYEDEMCSIAATHLFDPTAMMNLKKTLSSGDIAIVLSSNWREHRSVPKIRQIFSSCFFANYIIDKTVDIDDADYLNFRQPLITDFSRRGALIEDWLRTHSKVAYVIIDDIDDGLSNRKFAKHFVKINSEHLITHADAEKAIKILGQQ